ncbi:MAG: FAD:protein FMN transferase [Bacteroidales bacterium]|nr:FAD:protein FMN transferase [Bacteroidales bacterium]
MYFTVKILKEGIYLALIFFLLSSCAPEKEYSRFTGTTQGTTYSVVFENNDGRDPSELKAEVERIFARFDMSLSLYEDSSIVSKINRNEKARPDKWFVDVFQRSKEIYWLTGGSFDITVGPLVRAWGFGPDEHRNFDPEVIDSLRNLVGMDKVVLKNGEILKEDARIMLDFNAIAQGYAVDVVASYLEESGIGSFLVEIGGEVRVRGDKNGSLWRIGIDRPVENNFTPGQDLTAVIEMKDRSLATSGNYRKFYVEDGIKYSHTIDPRTGYPARNTLLSATILASDCSTADAVATACMVMGKDKTIEFLERHPEYDAYLVFSDYEGNFRTWMTESMEEFISQQ